MNHEETVYVTYDLDQTGKQPHKVIYRGAKKVVIPGEVLSWEVGEYKIHDVEDAFGVKLFYRPSMRSHEVSNLPNLPYLMEEEFVVLSSYAENVQVHRENIPEEYRPGLDNAA
jgi:hypothetical protein